MNVRMAIMEDGVFYHSACNIRPPSICHSRANRRLAVVLSNGRSTLLVHHHWFVAVGCRGDGDVEEEERK